MSWLPKQQLAAPLLTCLPPWHSPFHSQWTLVGNTPVESAIASEGLSLLTVPMAGCMVSFGGYNGRYHNAVHVYRPGVCCLLWSVQLGAGARGSARVVCEGSG